MALPRDGQMRLSIIKPPLSKNMSLSKSFCVCHCLQLVHGDFLKNTYVRVIVNSNYGNIYIYRIVYMELNAFSKGPGTY